MTASHLDPQTWIDLGLAPAEAARVASPERWERDRWAGQHVRLTVGEVTVDGTLRTPLHPEEDGTVTVEVAIVPTGDHRSDASLLNDTGRLDVTLEHADGRWVIDGGTRRGWVLEANRFPAVRVLFPRAELRRP